MKNLESKILSEFFKMPVSEIDKNIVFGNRDSSDYGFLCHMEIKSKYENFRLNDIRHIYAAHPDVGGGIVFSLRLDQGSNNLVLEGFVSDIEDACWPSDESRISWASES